MPEAGDQAHYYALLTSGKSFIYLQRRASPALVEQVNAIGEPAIVFDRDTQRLYPQSTMAAHAPSYAAACEKRTMRAASHMEDRAKTGEGGNRLPRGETTCTDRIAPERAPAIRYS